MKRDFPAHRRPGRTPPRLLHLNESPQFFVSPANLSCVLPDNSLWMAEAVLEVFVVTDRDALMNLVERIHDTLEDPERWPQVVPQVAGVTDGTRGLLFTPLHSVDEGGLGSAYGVAAQDLQSYFSYFKDTGLWVNRVRERNEPTNVPVNCDRLVPHSELKRSEWFNDLLKTLEIRRRG